MPRIFEKGNYTVNPSQIFGLGIRFFGLLTSFVAVLYLATGIGMSLGIPEDDPGDTIFFSVSGAAFLLLGMYLLRGAPGLVRYSYPARYDGTAVEEA